MLKQPGCISRLLFIGISVAICVMLTIKVLELECWRVGVMEYWKTGVTEYRNDEKECEISSIDIF